LNAANDDEKRANVEESLKLSIREVIERLCKANFPRSKREGRLSASSIQSACKVLIGYNWRTHHLIFTEDYNGHGLVRFKANFHKRTVKPEDWKDLFSKFPHGKGLIKDEKFNPNGEICVYDDVLGAEKIDSLTPGLMKRFIERNEKGFGTKKNFLEAFKCLWSFAADKGYLGDNIPNNPTMKVKFKRPEVANAPGSQYKDLRFTDEEFKLIQSKCLEKKDLYPFQAEACLMKTVTARRTEETCKFRWSMINKDETLITLPASITKSRKVEYIDITPPVKRVIDMLKEKLKGVYQKYRFVDWMFPTTRIDSKQLHSDKYVRSDQCRIKNIRGLWDSIRKDTGIFGSPTMIRTTVISMFKLELGTTSKARVLSGHEQDSTLDIHYDKHTTQQRREYANKVANVVDFAKVSNG
jgi:integrase